MVQYDSVTTMQFNSSAFFETKQFDLFKQQKYQTKNRKGVSGRQGTIRDIKFTSMVVVMVYSRTSPKGVYPLSDDYVRLLSTRPS